MIEEFQFLPRDERSAKRGIATISCLPVRWPETLTYRGHRGWFTWKVT